ncbi:RNA-directed DNA polymerase, eukaryota, reverse transcriptase zinc-binding domain protein [Tanacetum coccineum]
MTMVLHSLRKYYKGFQRCSKLFKIFAYDMNVLSIWAYMTMMVLRVCNHHRGRNVYTWTYNRFAWSGFKYFIPEVSPQRWSVVQLVTLGSSFPLPGPRKVKYSASVRRYVVDFLHELEDPASYIKFAQDRGEVIQFIPIIMVFQQVKDKDDSSYGTSMKTRRQRRHPEHWKRLGRLYFVVFVLVRNIIGTPECIGTLGMKLPKRCETSKRYNNDGESGGKGLKQGAPRQGDPMSPYLFTIVMEVFNLIIQQKISENDDFKYHHRCKSLKITHLCFADDLLVLCHGDVGSVKVIQQALDVFSNVSRLYPNSGKSTIFCGSMDRVAIDNILAILPFKRGKLLVIYLGVPLVAKKIEIKYCKSLIDKTVTKDIKRIFKAFLWNHGELQKGKAKVSWKEVCQPKHNDGLGFKPLDQWNNALLMKHLWNVAAIKDSLLLDVEKLVGFKGCNQETYEIQDRIDIYIAGFSNDDTVAECVQNNFWICHTPPRRKDEA